MSVFQYFSLLYYVIFYTTVVIFFKKLVLLQLPQELKYHGFNLERLAYFLREHLETSGTETFNKSYISTI